MIQSPIQNSIIEINGAKAGPAIAIFGGIHGNETVGVKVLDQLAESLTINAGTVYLVYANPKAIEAGVRFTEQDMNRCFAADPETVHFSNGVSYEAARASELKTILNRCDALIDLHAFNDLEGEPFIICNDLSMDIAKILHGRIISTGWENLHTGSTDAYMRRAGKVALCIECGPLSKDQLYLSYTLDNVHRFLNYFGLIAYWSPFSNTSDTEKRMFVDIKRSIKKTTADFAFARQFANFEVLKRGELIATDGHIEHRAEDDQTCILFLRPQKNIGGEVAILGKVSA